jgi:cytolysin-activating lysine-acyltransferase
MTEYDSRNGVSSPADFIGKGKSASSSAKPNIPQPGAVLGHVVWLMMNMPQYRHIFLADLEWMVLPPIMLGQYRLFHAENRVVAFAAWAYLSEAAEGRLQEPNPRLSPSEWKSGDRLWLIDLHAPYGHQELALKELRETAFKGLAFKMHRWTPQGRQTVQTAPEKNAPEPK